MTVLIFGQNLPGPRYLHLHLTFVDSPSLLSISFQNYGVVHQGLGSNLSMNDETKLVVFQEFPYHIFTFRFSFPYISKEFLLTTSVFLQG